MHATIGLCASLRSTFKSCEIRVVWYWMGVATLWVKAVIMANELDSRQPHGRRRERTLGFQSYTVLPLHYGVQAFISLSPLSSPLSLPPLLPSFPPSPSVFSPPLPSSLPSYQCNFKDLLDAEEIVALEFCKNTLILQDSDKFIRNPILWYL